MTADDRGEVYTVPVGLTLHCAVCGAVLESGDRCYIEHDDDSAILCLRCLSKRQNTLPGPTAVKKPEPLWMAYD